MEHLTINHIPTTIIKTDKFKTISFILVFIGDFNRDTATSRLLLNRVMASSTRHLETKKKLNDTLYALYDAYFTNTCIAMYKTLLTIYEIEVVDPKYVAHPTMIQDALALLQEVLTEPNVEENAFKQKEFEEEKRTLNDQILNIYNNKSLYSNIRLFELMAKDEIMKVSPSGSQIDLENITKESLFGDYKQMMQEEVRLYVIGNVNHSDLEGPLSHFQFSQSSKEHEFSGHYVIANRPFQKVVEEQQINQSRLLFGYETGVYHNSPDHDAMVVFNAMIGGMATSSLFMTIREQLSLAYQIGSTFSFEFGIFTISCGIDAAKEEIVIREVEAIIRSYQEGTIDPSLLYMAKEMIVSQLRESVDQPLDLFEQALRMDLINYPTTTEYIKQIEAITMEDVQVVSRKINLSAIFFLKGVNHDKN